MAILLDVNVLIALAWPNHLHHRRAHEWFAKNSADGWATCPLTQVAFVRISSNPAILPHAVSPQDALVELEAMCRLPHHEFWPDNVQITDAQHLHRAAIAGHRQVTDAYLLALALHRRGRLATFGRGVRSLLPQSAPQGTVILLES